MLKNYFKTAFRSLIIDKGFSFINMVGLAIGMAAAILIMLYIFHELSYDKFHKDYDRIYRVAVNGRMSGDFFEVAVTPAPMASSLKNEFPEVESSVCMRQMSQEALFRRDEHVFFESDVYYADSMFFRIFDFEPLIGDIQTALYEPFSMVITQTIARKYFGNENPMGQVIQLNDQFSFKVTAVIQDPPLNSHFRFPVLLSWSSIEKMMPGRHFESWGSLGFYTYLKLNENVDVTGFEAKIEKYIMTKLIEQSGEDAGSFKDVQLEFNSYLQPIQDIHLHSNLMAELSPNSDISYVYTFAAIALFILIIACINFMNLTTARSARRAKEVGIRKVHGGYRSQLVFQFFTESVLMSFIALVIAVLLVEITFPIFNDLLGQQMQISTVSRPNFLVYYFLIALIVGLAAGSYPAFYLSAFQPAKVLKGGATKGSRHVFLRNLLVIFQFTISIILIIGTGLIYKQLDFVRNKRLGFDKEHVMQIQLRNDRLQEKSDVIVSEFRNLPEVVNAAGSSSGLGGDTDGTAYFPEGESDTEPWLVFNSGIDYNFIETMQMELILGRNFSPDFATDTAAMILNETLWKKLGWGDEAIGKKMRPGDPSSEFVFHVIGVVRDFHFESLHDKIEPFAFYLQKTNSSNISIKVQGDNLKKSIVAISEKWSEIEAGFPFDFTFLDQSMDKLYNTEKRIGKLFIYFSIIAIFIACLGLFGLASFIAEQRTKEIGVRKTFGASTSELAVMMTRDFTLWVLLSNIIAWPLAYYFFNRWLQAFAFRIDIINEWYIFPLAGLVSFVIAIFTVVYQVLKAANSSPIDALKYE
jgi:putative ABC transport system permease protein